MKNTPVAMFCATTGRMAAERSTVPQPSAIDPSSWAGERRATPTGVGAGKRA